MDDATQNTYTPEQRETLEAGLRILAQMNVREHLRRRSASSDKSGSKLGEPTHTCNSVT